MKLLLYSDYKCMPNADILKMLGISPNNFNVSASNFTCLICNYADENAPGYTQRVKTNLSKVFSKIIDLTLDYQFKDKIDCIFVNGGNNFELIYKLKKYKQFDKLKNLVLGGTLYMGNSAGSVVCGREFMYSNAYEPPVIKMDLNKYCLGFNFIDYNVLVHAGKFIIKSSTGKLQTEVEYLGNYLKYKRYQSDPIKIPNNAVAIVTDSGVKVKRYPWNKLLEYYKNECM